MANTKKPLNLSIQGLFGFAVWLHDLDSNRKISKCFTKTFYKIYKNYIPKAILINPRLYGNSWVTMNTAVASIPLTDHCISLTVFIM
ncbi:hypothetical protein EMIT0194MI4_10567 [Pseudomonas sp. IT-194MI4]